jgi:SAM-dependent methyltransferase
MNKQMADTLNHFSNRVDNYIRYRPGYPSEMLAFIIKEKMLKADSVIADIGSGTGISAKQFLVNGNKVFGVEPNKEMREAAEKLLSASSNFVSIAGTAEATGLKSKSVDILIAAQAFHWFDKELFKQEVLRVVKPGGFVLITWNDRLIDQTEFLMEYESLLHNFSVDYEQAGHRNISAKDIRNYFFSFIDARSYKEAKFKNFQDFDFESLMGRLLSSSYTPTEDHVNFKEMIKELNRIYGMYNKEGLVRFEYDTLFYSGQLK